MWRKRQLVGAKDAIYRVALLTEIGYPQETIRMYCGNAATVVFATVH